MSRNAPTPRGVVETMGAYLPGQGAPGKTKLSSNENPFPPSDAVIQRLRAELANLNRYPAHGAEPLREVLSTHLFHQVADTAFVSTLSKDEILVGNGSVTLLRQIYEAFVDPGDEVLVGWRSFEAYPLFARARGAVEVQVPLVNGQFDMDALIAAITPKTRLVVLTSPNNPSGSVIAHQPFVDLLGAVPEQCLVVLDNAYHEFDRNRDGVSGVDLLAEWPNLVVLRTLSKAYALAGLRIGYGFGHATTIKAIDTFRSPFEINSLAQAAAIAAIETGSAIESQLESLVQERDRAIVWLWAGGLPVGTSQGNFVWIDAGELTAPLNEHLLSDGFVTRVFPDEGLRISMGFPDDNDGWVGSLLDAWQSPAFADARARTAPAVAEVLAASRPRHIHLDLERGFGDADLWLQALTYDAAHLGSRLT